MEQLNKESGTIESSTIQLEKLLAKPHPPCISLYQPTFKRHPENQQNLIRYGNLLKEVEQSLLEGYSDEEVKPLLDRLQGLVEDHSFWNHRTEGLAILLDQETFEVIDLQQSVESLVVVADSFHVKPLLRQQQSADRYQVLCFSRQHAKLFIGNRYALNELSSSKIPSTITEALGEELTSEHQTVASYGGTSREMHHGHGGKSAEVDIDRDRYFRAIDRAILEHHTFPSSLPLILAALPEHHTPFREISHNSHITDKGIKKDPDSLTPEQLHEAAWEAFEPRYQDRLAAVVEKFSTAQAAQQGSAELPDVARAAAQGRVATLLIEADRNIPGRIDSEGKLQSSELSNPKIDDQLDDLAEMVIRMKGEVTVLPSEHMPSSTGLAAVYRY